MKRASKRFYKSVTVAAGDGGFEIRLDGKMVRTPGKAVLLAPAAQLAEAIAAEWRVQGDVLDARTMPLTGLTNAAIDHIVPRKAEFVDQIAAFGASDLICYRAVRPVDLVRRQAAAWQPLVDWAEVSYGARLRVVKGVMPVDQDRSALAALRAEVDALPPMALAGLHAVATTAGSLVIGLAVQKRRLDADAAWRAAEIDEDYQVEQWGDDEEAKARREFRRADFLAGATFLRLLE